MKTPSHIIAVYALSRAFPQWKINKKTLIIGAIAPDVLLVILFISTLFVSAVQGLTLGGAVERFSRLYFEHPLCIAAYNILHAPISLMAWAAYIFVFTKHNKAHRHILFSFLSGCVLHAFCDIFTHHDDGPLLLWPFNWTLRYSSPVSHWDPAHFGLVFFTVEVAASLILALWLVYRYAHMKRR